MILTAVFLFGIVLRSLLWNKRQEIFLKTRNMQRPQKVHGKWNWSMTLFWCKKKILKPMHGFSYCTFSTGFMKTFPTILLRLWSSKEMLIKHLAREAKFCFLKIFQIYSFLGIFYIGSIGVTDALNPLVWKLCLCWSSC